MYIFVVSSDYGFTLSRSPSLTPRQSDDSDLDETWEPPVGNALHDNEDDDEDVDEDDDSDDKELRLSTPPQVTSLKPKRKLVSEVITSKAQKTGSQLFAFETAVAKGRVGCNRAIARQLITKLGVQVGLRRPPKACPLCSQLKVNVAQQLVHIHGLSKEDAKQEASKLPRRQRRVVAPTGVDNVSVTPSVPVPVQPTSSSAVSTDADAVISATTVTAAVATSVATVVKPIRQRKHCMFCNSFLPP